MSIRAAANRPLCVHRPFYRFGKCDETFKQTMRVAQSRGPESSRWNGSEAGELRWSEDCYTKQPNRTRLEAARLDFRTSSAGSLRSNAMLVECSSFALAGPHGLVSDEIPEVIRHELNADRDRDLLVRMRHLAGKKRMREPDISDEAMADYLALAENFQNFAQWLSARRSAFQHPSGSGAGWIALTAAVVGILTAMLIVAIAIAV